MFVQSVPFALYAPLCSLACGAERARTDTAISSSISQLGALEFARVLVASSERGVLVTVFIVGCALTTLSRCGFIGTEDLPGPSRWTYSLMLLAASAATILWAFTYTSSTLLAVAVPMMGLFGLRRLLIARWLDRSDRGNSSLAIRAGLGEAGHCFRPSDAGRLETFPNAGDTGFVGAVLDTAC